MESKGKFYIMFRIGASCLDVNVCDALKDIVDYERTVEFAVPGSTVTIMFSDGTLEDLTKIMSTFNYCFFIFELKQCSMMIPANLKAELENTLDIDLGTFHYDNECTWTLDELLAKIHEKGIDSLTKLQKQRLTELSKEV